MCTLIGVGPALTGCRDDQKEIVVVDTRPMRRLAVRSCWSIIVEPAVDWELEPETGCTGGVPCPLQAAASRACPDGSDGPRAADTAQSIVAAARLEPRCDAIVVIDSATLGSGPARRSIEQPHWMLEIAHRSPEPGHPWVLVRGDTRRIDGYGQGTTPEIVREMCALVRESTASRKRTGNGP